MSDRKINFYSKFTIKLSRATVGNADTGSLKFLQTLFDTHLEHMLAKFEPGLMLQNVHNFEFLTKKKRNLE